MILGDRRNFIGNLVGVVLPTLVAAACKPKGGGGTTPQEQVPTSFDAVEQVPESVETDTQIASEIATDVEAEDGGEVPDCGYSALATDLARIKDASEELIPNVKCYGTVNSVLVAMDFPKYQGGSMSEIYLVRENGNLIAQKRVDSTYDYGPDGRVLAQLFENMRIDEKEKIVILTKTGSEFCKYKLSSGVELERKFQNKKVVGLTNIFCPPGFFEAQAFPLIKPRLPKGSADYVEKPTFVGLHSGTEFEVSADLSGFTICDLMGKVLSTYGENFRAFYGNQAFICYKPVGAYYVRTFVRLV